MKKFTSILVLIFVSTILTSCKTYNEIMTKALKESLGNDFKDYSAFSYPTDNFGILTSYNQELDPRNQLCAMYTCLDNLELESQDDWLDFKGLVNVGQGGSINLSETKQKNATLDAVIPELWEVLNIEGGFEKDNIESTNLTFNKGYVRFLNKLKLQDYINELDDNNQFKRAFINGDLVVVVSDVIVTDLTVNVKVNEETATKLNAALDGTTMGTKEDPKLNFEYEKKNDGNYTFKVQKPVIVLRLAKKQPQAGGLGVSDDFDEWTKVDDFLDDKR